MEKGPEGPIHLLASTARLSLASLGADRTFRDQPPATGEEHDAEHETDDVSEGTHSRWYRLSRDESGGREPTSLSWCTRART